MNLYHKKSPKRAPNPYRDPCPNPFSSYLHPCANAHPKSRFQSTSRSRSKSLHSPIEMFMRIPIRIPIHSLSESAIQSSTPIPLQILVHITIETPIEMIHQVRQPLFKALCRCLSKSRSEYIVYIDVYVYMYRLKQASPYPIGPKKDQNRTTVQLTLIEQVMKKWTKHKPTNDPKNGPKMVQHRPQMKPKSHLEPPGKNM